jgi:hypothetical protein
MRHPTAWIGLCALLGLCAFSFAKDPLSPFDGNQPGSRRDSSGQPSVRIEDASRTVPAPVLSPPVDPASTPLPPATPPTVFPPLPPGASTIEAALNQLTVIEVEDMPLSDVLDFLADLHEIPIRFEQDTDRARGEKLKISVQLRGVTLRSALRKVLKPHQFTTYRGGRELVVSSSRGEATADFKTRVFSVAGIAATADEVQEVMEAIDATLVTHGEAREESGVSTFATLPGKPVSGALAVVYTNTEAGHLIIEELLDNLRQAGKLRLPAPANPITLPPTDASVPRH